MLGFAHTSYWTWKSDFGEGGPPDHIVTLRKAVNILDKPDPFVS
jgi:hypothetical protein